MSLNLKKPAAASCCRCVQPTRSVAAAMAVRRRISERWLRRSTPRRLRTSAAVGGACGDAGRREDLDGEEPAQRVPVVAVGRPHQHRVPVPEPVAQTAAVAVPLTMPRPDGRREEQRDGEGKEEEQGTSRPPSPRSRARRTLCPRPAEPRGLTRRLPLRQHDQLFAHGMKRRLLVDFIRFPTFRKQRSRPTKRFSSLSS
jgi:hypothetical protein